MASPLRLILCFLAALPAFPSLRVEQPRCEYLANPAGIEETSPRFSWIVAGEGRARRQTAYRVLVAATEAALAKHTGDMWDTGKVTSTATNQIAYKGKPLTSRTAAHWKVMVWDEGGKPSAWSAPARFSMGLLQPGDWRAEWIGYRDTAPLHKTSEPLYLPPPRHYRKEFRVAKPVRRAVLYSSALGIYEASLNGRRIGDALFAPGWSDYRRRAYYHAYDVTPLVQQGGNAIGAIVADGWYAGYIGFGVLVGYGPYKSGRYFYGKTPALLAQLEIDYADGGRDTIATDATWKHATGPILEADLQMGETYDARREIPGWDRAGFDDSSWQAAIRAQDNGSIRAPYHDRGGDREVELGFIRPRRLQAHPGVPVRPIEEIRPKSVTERKPGVWIFDLGQNISGVVRLHVRGPAGTRVQLRHGEMLHPDGSLMTENLRRARAIDVYVLRGDPQGETYTPRFTFHGFQYVELTGFPGKPEPGTIAGVVIHSDTPLTSRFSASDPMVNRLHQNIVWTQRANFLELPTDCPQRDERLGWTGDAQIYARAATYNADVAAFFTKWLDDLEESQLANGAYPAYAPFPMQHGPRAQAYGTAWMDAGIICPYTIHLAYNDRRVLERHYASMLRFMDFRAAQSPDHRGKFIGNDWGDWLNLNSPTPVEFIDAAYYHHTARLMSEMADAIGKTADAAHYRALADKIRAAFAADYLNPGGSLKVNTQTAYAIALSFDLMPANVRQAAGDRLAQLVRDAGNKMTTGFLGTRPLLPSLTATGHHDLAAELFLSREYPSWGYEVENGATTIWERWNSYTKGQGFHNASMNSFSHYAFGAVSEWMFSALAGIDTDGPGYQRLRIRPLPPAGLDWVRASYQSIAGPVETAWSRRGGRFQLDVTIPANTTAAIEIPARKPDAVTESGKPLAAAPGVKLLRSGGGKVVVEAGSGTYRFEAQ